MKETDLSPCDSFLFGNLKQKVYVTPPDDLPTLRKRTVDAVNEIRQKPQFITNVFAAMRTRANTYLQNNGRQVESGETLMSLLL